MSRPESELTPEEAEALRLDAGALFGYEHDGPCCDCCNGYCVMSDSDPTWRWAKTLHRLTIDRVKYIGSRYTVVREDLLDHLGDVTIEDVPPGPALRKFRVPDVRPVPSHRPQRVTLMDALDRAGLDRCDSAHAATGMTHLYRGDVHVGWSAYATDVTGSCILPDQLALVRQVADAAQIGIRAAASALNAARNLEAGKS